ncbi:MAG: type II toxin-antitoxin system HicB family antitoxin [Clostridia bacterium]|nr:type II toxin-antitoxin system HicB family antitoxin [Clostridia bacterium]
MLSIYPACFYEENEGGYSVIFPVLEVATCGDNLEEAMTMAIDLLAGYLYDAKINGEEVPKPPKVSEIDVNAECKDYKTAFVNLVSVDVDEYAKKHFEKAVKKTLTIPAWLNDLAIKEGINFSQLLQNALRQQLNV